MLPRRLLRTTLPLLMRPPTHPHGILSWMHSLRILEPATGTRPNLPDVCSVHPHSAPRRRCAVSLLPTPPPNYRSQSSFSGASTPMTLWFARSHHPHMVMPAVSHFPNPLTSPRISRTSRHSRVQTHVRDVDLFQSLAPWYSPWSNLAIPNLTGSVTVTPLTVISCIINIASPSCIGIQDQRAGIQQIIAAICGRFHAVISQEASDHVPHITDQFIGYTGNTDLAILLSKDTFEPNPAVFAFKEDSTSKGARSMVLLIVRGLLRQPSGTPTVTFCSVHIHNFVAKKRDASTALPRRLHCYMEQYNVDFIGGDFNMSAFSTVSDVFPDPEFSAPGNSFLWGLGALEEQNRERTGFLIMPKRRVDTHGCYKIRQRCAWLWTRDQTAHLPVFLHLRTTNLLGPDSIMRSEQAQPRRMERRRHNRARRRRT